MRKRFLEKLHKKYPNNYQLGEAVRRYYHLRLQGHSKDECEEIVLQETLSEISTLNKTCYI